MNFGQRIYDNIHFLRRLCRCSSENQRWRLIKTATFDEILSVVEIATNILCSNFCLSKKQKTRLVPFAPLIRQLARKRSEQTARRLLVVQKGNGFLFTALLAPVIAEAARVLVKKLITDRVDNNGQTVDDSA